MAFAAATTSYPSCANWFVTFPAAPATLVPLKTRTVTSELPEDVPEVVAAFTVVVTAGLLDDVVVGLELEEGPEGEI